MLHRLSHADVQKNAVWTNASRTAFCTPVRHSEHVPPFCFEPIEKHALNPLCLVKFISTLSAHFLLRPECMLTLTLFAVMSWAILTILKERCLSAFDHPAHHYACSTCAESDCWSNEESQQICWARRLMDFACLDASFGCLPAFAEQHLTHRNTRHNIALVHQWLWPNG